MKKDFFYYYKKLLYAERQLALAEYSKNKISQFYNNIKVKYYKKKTDKLI